MVPGEHNSDKQTQREEDGQDALDDRPPGEGLADEREELEEEPRPGQVGQGPLHELAAPESGGEGSLIIHARHSWRVAALRGNLNDSGFPGAPPALALQLQASPGVEHGHPSIGAVPLAPRDEGGIVNGSGRKEESVKDGEAPARVLP